MADAIVESADLDCTDRNESTLDDDCDDTNPDVDVDCSATGGGGGGPGEKESCGCETSGAPVGPAWLMGLALVALRRRSAAGA